LTLLTEPDRLRLHFSLQSLGTDDQGLAWLELVPVPASDADTANSSASTPMAEFSRILVAFADNLLARMVLEDSLGQRTEVQFTDAQRNVALDAELFEFVPPEGVDVLEG
jgi:outer membrane lipoprotein carrier protein